MVLKNKNEREGNNGDLSAMQGPKREKTTDSLSTMQGPGLTLSEADKKNRPDRGSDFEDLREKVLTRFMDICGVARRSGYSTKIVSYIKDFAKNHGIEPHSERYVHKGTKKTYRGENVWFDLKATKGCEDYPAVILQAHTDMVPKWDSGVKHNFTKDPIKVKIDGDKVTAEGTSLGADNGIGIALMLSLVESKEPHGPIRLLFTGDEEVDFIGASHLDKSVFNAPYLINLDYEDSGRLCYSSAGSLMVDFSKEFKESPLKEEELLCKISFDKLRGGHSGVQINDKTLLHGNIAVMEVVKAFQNSNIPVRFSKIELGTASNSIPGSSSVNIAIPKDRLAEAKEIFAIIADTYGIIYSEEENMNVSFKVLSKKDKKAISTEATETIVALFSSLPHGVFTISPKNDQLVETSSYTGKVSLQRGKLAIDNCTRSCNKAHLDELNTIYRSIGKIFGIEPEIGSSYPWDGDPKSKFVQYVKKAYQEGTGIEPEVEAVHAGLECSVFKEKKDGLEMISFGPTIVAPHSTKETLYASTVGICAKALNHILAHINELNEDK